MLFFFSFNFHFFFLCSIIWAWLKIITWLGILCTSPLLSLILSYCRFTVFFILHSYHSSFLSSNRIGFLIPVLKHYKILILQWPKPQNNSSAMNILESQYFTQAFSIFSIAFFTFQETGKSFFHMVVI